MIANKETIPKLAPLIIQLWNDKSIDEAKEILFHLNIGFEEENRIICLKKLI